MNKLKFEPFEKLELRITIRINKMATKKSGGGGKKSPPPKKQSSDSLSSLASQVLKGKKPTQKQAQSLAGSVLSQDETKGKRK